MAEISQGEIGDKVPTLTLQDHTGQQVALADFWRAGPLVLALTRHLG